VIEIVNRDMIGESVGGPAGPVAAAPTLPTEVIREFVGCDSKQPGSDSGRLPTKPIKSGQGLLKRCRRDVLGERNIATSAQHESIDRVDVQSIESRERISIGSRPLDERLLVEPGLIISVRVHHPPA
jgi:hypothetical protein